MALSYGSWAIALVSSLLLCDNKMDSGERIAEFYALAVPEPEDVKNEKGAVVKTIPPVSVSLDIGTMEIEIKATADREDEIAALLRVFKDAAGDARRAFILKATGKEAGRIRLPENLASATVEVGSAESVLKNLVTALGEKEGRAAFKATGLKADYSSARATLNIGNAWAFVNSAEDKKDEEKKDGE